MSAVATPLRASSAADLHQQLSSLTLEMTLLRQRLADQTSHLSQLQMDREKLLLTVDDRRGGRDLLAANTRLIKEAETELESLQLRIGEKARIQQPLQLQHAEVLEEEQRAKEAEDVARTVAADSAALAKASALVDEAAAIFRKVLSDARRRTGWTPAHGFDRSKFRDPANGAAAGKSVTRAARATYDAMRVLLKIQ